MEKNQKIEESIAESIPKKTKTARDKVSGNASMKKATKLKVARVAKKKSAKDVLMPEDMEDNSLIKMVENESEKVEIKKNIKDILMQEIAKDVLLVKPTEPKSDKFYAEQKTEDILTQQISEPERKSITKTKEKEKIKKFGIVQFIAILIMVAITIGSGTVAFYFYNKYKKIAISKTDDTQNDDIQTKVGRLIELPNETATLATVTDKEKMKNQPFFEHAENGDKALLYMQSKKAILYRPSINKIIEVMYISASPSENDGSLKQQEENMQQSQTEIQEQPQNQPQEDQAQIPSSDAKVEVIPARVSVYNGTNKNGLAASVAEKLSSEENLTIVEKSNAKKYYEKTLIVDLNGNMAETVRGMQEIIGGEIGALPDGEIKPEADILIIAGNQ